MTVANFRLPFPMRVETPAARDPARQARLADERSFSIVVPRGGLISPSAPSGSSAVVRWSGQWHAPASWLPPCDPGRAPCRRLGPGHVGWNAVSARTASGRSWSSAACTAGRRTPVGRRRRRLPDELHYCTKASDAFVLRLACHRSREPRRTGRRARQRSPRPAGSVVLRSRSRRSLPRTELFSLCDELGVTWPPRRRAGRRARRSRGLGLELRHQRAGAEDSSPEPRACSSRARSL